MSLCCPRCHSVDLRLQQRAEHTCGVLGITAGAAAGFSGALTGAEAAARVPTGPIGMIARALLGALAVGAAGCVAGIQLGRIVDQSLIGDLECNYCGHAFFNENAST